MEAPKRTRIVRARGYISSGGREGSGRLPRIPTPATQAHPGETPLDAAGCRGVLEAILIEVTRPVGEAFSVRIFDEDHTPPEADVVAGYVFYGVSVPEGARRLVIAWNALHLNPKTDLRASTFVTYDHDRGFKAVIGTIEALQESYLP
jgi:hypothetical protein